MNILLSDRVSLRNEIYADVVEVLVNPRVKQ